VAAGALVVAVAASPVPYLTETFGVAYLLVVVPADVGMLYAAYESYGDAGVGQAHLKYAQFLAVVAFLAGRLVEPGTVPV